MPEVARPASRPASPAERSSALDSRTPARRRIDRAFLVFAVVTIGLALAHIVVLRIRKGHFGWITLAPILGGAGLLLGFAAWRIARGRLPLPVRGPLALVVAYHACFGPAMLLYSLTTPVGRNGDLIPSLFPHVVRWINSFE